MSYTKHLSRANEKIHEEIALLQSKKEGISNQVIETKNVLNQEKQKFSQKIESLRMNLADHEKNEIDIKSEEEAKRKEFEETRKTLEENLIEASREKEVVEDKRKILLTENEQWKNMLQKLSREEGSNVNQETVLDLQETLRKNEEKIKVLQKKLPLIVTQENNFIKMF